MRKKMCFDEMIRKEMKTSEFSEMESTDEIIEKIRENTLNSLEEQTERAKKELKFLSNVKMRMVILLVSLLMCINKGSSFKKDERV